MWIHTDRYGMTWINHDKTINHFRPMFTRIPTLCLTLLRQSQHIQHVVQLYNLTKPVIAGKGQQSKWNMNEWDGNSFCNSVFFHTVTPEVDYLWHPVTTRKRHSRSAVSYRGEAWTAWHHWYTEMSRMCHCQIALNDMHQMIWYRSNDMIRIKWYDTHQMILYPII